MRYWPSLKQQISILLLVSGCAQAVGCSRNPVPFSNHVPIIGSAPDFVAQESLDRIDMKANESVDRAPIESRNEFIAEKMYMIDREYSEYESNLSKQDGFGNLANDLATIGMTSASAVIPLGATTKILNQTVLAATAARTAYDKDILLTQTIQSIILQMRTDRANQAKLITSRMSCTEKRYPFFMAMSDLETYRRAGTYESAIPNMEKAIAVKEAVAVASKDKVLKTGAKSDIQAALLTLIDSVAVNDPCPIGPPKKK